nr:metallophosphoesterase [uncultured Bacteroides sp.]
MEENNINNHIFRILILSDLHYESKRKDDFERIFNPFLDKLSAFLKNHQEWSPQCLVLAGDIAHSENDMTGYDDIRSYIEKIKLEIGISFQVVAVPGNHDKQLTPIEYTKEELTALKNSSEEKKKSIKAKAQLRVSEKDLEAAKMFLNMYTNPQPEVCSKNSEYLKKYFGNYARFISSYYDTVHWHPIPDIKIDSELKSISGYYLLEYPKICLVALNTEWQYVVGNAGGHRSILTLDENITKQVEKHVKGLKRNGYTIITIMHRSPYRLCWNDIYGRLDENSLVERIIGISDLIICGHEHNTKNREPDMLMNSTLLYQNGSMFDRNKEDGRYPYSASLLRIDTKARMLNVIRIRFNTGNALTYEWTVASEDVKSYCMEPMTSSKPRLKTLNNELYKEISFSSPIEPDLLQKKIRSLFYPGNSPENIPNYINCCILTLDTKTESIVKQKIHAIKQKITDGEPLPKLYVLILYSERFEGNKIEIQTQHAISSYKKIKSLIKSEEIGHKLITNLVFCNILF